MTVLFKLATPHTRPCIPGAPLLQQLRPTSTHDMLAWARSEAEESALDSTVSILYDLAGASEQASLMHLTDRRNVVNAVLSLLPLEVVVMFTHRMFLRLTCFMTGTAAVQDMSSPLVSDVAATRWAGRFGT